MAKIIGPGSLNVDVTGFAPRLPVGGETVKGTSLYFSPGGKGSNQMTAAHRAGAQVCLIGRRGTDVLGDILHSFYVSEGMSEARILSTPDLQTGSALIEIDQRDAQNRIIVIPAANNAVSAADVYAAEAEFADADAVLTQLETTTEAVLAAKDLAKKYGKPFILNPAPYVDIGREAFNGVDYVTPNEFEAEQFTGVRVESVEDCRRAAQVFFDMGVKNVIITLGVRGAFYSNGKTELHIPALKMKAVETTGAGDAFNGGFVTALSEGADVETALKFATCTSAISVTRAGAAASMPKREEILALLKEKFNVTL